MTSTSANHFANMAKELSRKVQNFLAGVKFYSTDISIIGSTDGGTISSGMNTEGLSQIKQGLTTLAKLNSLIAFFREAIKEKERLGDEAANWEDSEARAAYDDKAKAHRENKPVRGAKLTELDVLESWSIGEQEKCLSLEAEASTLGKYIHEDGSISKARVELMKIMSSPISINENGRDTIIHKFTPTVGLEDVDEMFMSLQAHYREVQAELNGMKKRIEDTLNENSIKVDEEYRLALQKWNAEGNALEKELQLIFEEESAKRAELSKEVQALKIVVPNRLKEIFEAVSKTS